MPDPRNRKARRVIGREKYRREPPRRPRNAGRIQHAGVVKIRKKKDIIDKINEYIGEIHKPKPCPRCGSPLLQNRSLRAWFCTDKFHLFELKPVPFSRWRRVVLAKWKRDFKPKRSKGARACKDCGIELTPKASTRSTVPPVL